MPSAFDWSNSTCQPFLSSNWHFWQMTQMSTNVCYLKLKKRRCLDKCRLSAPAEASVTNHRSYSEKFSLLSLRPSIYIHLWLCLARQVAQYIPKEFSFWLVGLLPSCLLVVQLHGWGAQLFLPPPWWVAEGRSDETSHLGQHDALRLLIVMIVVVIMMTNKRSYSGC